VGGLVLGLTLAFTGSVARADLVIPGANGTDGVLNITANTVIDLSQAVTGAWDSDNSANIGKGVYDKDKWAVVFKYSSVTVAAGATVTFKNHASRAPVVWLVNGDVTINGTVSLDGAAGVTPPSLAEPGPGGFRGGQGYYSSGVAGSAGFGPGGGSRLSDQGYSGSYATLGYGGSKVYGNPSLVPLAGGSGGGGDGDHSAGGGAGGGSMLVACRGQLSVGGSIRANGGAHGWAHAGGGSGGGFRLVASGITGNGNLQALGRGGHGDGGLGRIRLERASHSGSLTVTPDPSIVSLADGATALIWPPDTAPSMKVVSIGGVTAPEDPRAEFGAVGADVALPQTSTVQVVIETTRVEEGSQVNVRRAPRSNGEYTSVTATKDTVLSTDPLVIRWVANVPVGTGYSALQVHVVRP
jgi:plastocyanin